VSPRFQRSRPEAAPTVALASALICCTAAAQPQASVDRPYTIECVSAAETEGAVACRTDLATFIGRRVFDQYCASCHAADALGSTFAPPLGDRVKRLSLAAFRNVLESGYRGDAAALPRWAEIPDVQRYSEPLWTYLLARGNGDLPPGPIGLLPDAAAP
jgi:mono/diheme cytochrome c family protein